MATAGLLALIDDIATLLDDVAVFTKVAAKKTAGVLGDDLALNAEQVSGIRAERELPVVWAVAKGSAKNKLLLVPLALTLSAIASWTIAPLLMLGGAFLCLEGFEKITHAFYHDSASEVTAHKKKLQAVSDPAVDLVEFEKNKIKGAIRTDFILSAEIVVIALGTVQAAPFIQQVLVISLLAALITVGVYGLVAGIVKLDDVGLHLLKEQAEDLSGRVKRALGRAVLRFCPYLMKTLSVVGTIAMFLVGGGILVHGVSPLHHFVGYLSEVAAGISLAGPVLAVVAPTLIHALLGVVAGGLLFALVSLSKRVIGAVKGAA